MDDQQNGKDEDKDQPHFVGLSAVVGELYVNLIVCWDNILSYLRSHL